MGAENLKEKIKHKQWIKASIATATLFGILNIWNIHAETGRIPKDSLPSKDITAVNKTELDTLQHQYKISGIEIKDFKNNTLIWTVKMDSDIFIMNIEFTKTGEKYINPKIIGMASWFFDLENKDNKITILPGKIQAVDSLQWMKLSKEVWKLNDKILNIQLPEWFKKKEYDPNAKLSELPIIFDEKEPFNVHLQIKKDSTIYKIHFNKSWELLPNQTIIVDNNFYHIQQNDSALVLEKSRYYNDEKNNRIYGTNRNWLRFEIQLNEKNQIDLEKIANTNPKKYKKWNEILISEELIERFQYYQRIKQAIVTRGIERTWKQRHVEKESCEPKQDGTIVLMLRDNWINEKYSIIFKEWVPNSPIRIEWLLYRVRFSHWEIVIWW